MKKTLLAFSLLTASGLVAEPYVANNCCPPEPVCAPCPAPCPPPPCEPCCVPQPKKCIDCVCYTPAYYDLQCDWGTFVSVDFLYWFARENNMPYALEYRNQPFVITATGTTPTPTNGFAPVRYDYVHTKWSPGVRVALGWNTNYDGWDTNVNWTWQKNSKKTVSSIDGYTPTTAANFDIPAINTDGLINPWVNAAMSGFPTSGALAGTSNFVLTFDTVVAKWRLQFNQIDLEIGRKYWLSKHFTMRPYAGVRGAWTKTRFQTVSSLVTGTGATAVNRNFRDRFIDHYWGVGILAGFQPNWYFGCNNNFSVYANFEGALIYGKYRSRKNETYSQTLAGVTQVAFSDLSHNTFFMMEPILDLGLGFSWQENWCCDRYRTELDIGWEQHIWFSSNHRMITQVPHFVAGTTNVSSFSAYDTVNTDLMFGGLVVRLRFDF